MTEYGIRSKENKYLIFLQYQYFCSTTTATPNFDLYNISSVHGRRTEGSSKRNITWNVTLSLQKRKKGAWSEDCDF